MPGYYPVFLNIRGKKCVVVGGGEVAERKVKTLVGNSALVTVISPHLSQGLSRLQAQGLIQVYHREFQPRDLEEAFIVIAATDNPAVNAEVARRGQEKGILTNVVDAPENSNFIIPSLVQRGNITIAISTGGKSPALARKLRMELEERFGWEYDSLAQLLSETRDELKRRRLRVAGDAWQKSLNISLLLDMIAQGKFQEAKEMLLAELTAKAKEA